MKMQKNLIQLGESKKSISIIGSPDIDIMHSPDLPSLDEVKVRYEIKFSSYAISLFHPVTTEVDKFEEYSNTYIDSLIESKNYIVILPNNDLGHQYIFNALKRIEDNKKFQVFPSLRFEYFLTLLKNAKFIIGNSSAGVREAPIYGTPSINIGSRQHNRSNSKRIINIEMKKDEIITSIHKIKKSREIDSEFGDGKSASKFYKIITDDLIWQTQFKKLLKNYEP